MTMTTQNAEVWKTLFDGEKATDRTYNADGSCNGYLLWLWDNQLTTGENTLAAGDTVKVTIDGVATTYMVLPDDPDAVMAGNRWLSVKKTSTLYTDDGTDFYFWEWKGGLRSFVRNSGTYQVKFEVAVPVPETDPNARIMGWIVGKRLAAQRGKA